MADFVDPGLNAVLNVLGAADTGLNIGDLVGQISNIFASFVNMARGFGQWIMGAFKIVQNTLTKIFMAIGFAGLISFIIGLITVMINGIQPWAKALRAHLDCAAHQYNTGWRNQGYILSVLAPCTWEKFLTFILNQFNIAIFC